jgi:hypothetical protein
MPRTSQEKQEKPRIFIGSSVEGLHIANSIQLLLEHIAEPTVWTQGVFEPSSNTLEDLIDLLDRIDFGIFVFSPDDVSKIRKQKFVVARDNVIFEMGLFIGRIGKKRVFYIIPRHREKFHLPSDLLGVTPLDYDNNRSDGNTQAALGSPCTKIIERISKLGRFEKGNSNTNDDIQPANSIFTPQEEADFNFIYSKLNCYSEAKCHVSLVDSSTNKEVELQERGCLFRYSFLEVLAKNVLDGAIRYNDEFLEFIKFENYETFRKYTLQGYKFGKRHIDKKQRGFLASLGILTAEIKGESIGYGMRDYAIYRIAEKAYRFVLWLNYYNKIEDEPKVEFVKFLKHPH